MSEEHLEKDGDVPEQEDEEMSEDAKALREAEEAGLVPTEDGQIPTEYDEEEEVEFDLEAQIEVFRNQIDEDPDNCVHHYNLGEALVELGDLEEALEEFYLKAGWDDFFENARGRGKELVHRVAGPFFLDLGAAERRKRQQRFDRGDLLTQTFETRVGDVEPIELAGRVFFEVAIR